MLIGIIQERGKTWFGEKREQGLCRGYLEHKQRYIDISSMAAEGKAKDMLTYSSWCVNVGSLLTSPYSYSTI